MTTPVPVNTTYELFSTEPIYVEANRAFVERQPLDRVRRFLDLACGTGTVSELLIEQSPGAHLSGVDLDPVQIDLSTQRFTRLGYPVRRGFGISDEVQHGKPMLQFGVCSADDLPFPDETFDCVTIAHAIHLLPDLATFLRGVARVVKTGGVFGFNTAFYAGCMPPGTDRIYIDWMQLASAYIESGNREREAAGLPPIKRQRGARRGTPKRPWYTLQEWQDMLAEAGLVVHDHNERRVELDARCLALVGAYGGMAEVMMSGFPVEASSEALQATAQAALEKSGTASAPRNYLEVWATKT